MDKELILEKLGKPQAGDNQVWIGKNYSKAQLRKDIEGMADWGLRARADKKALRDVQKILISWQDNRWADTPEPGSIIPVEKEHLRGMSGTHLY